jgi:polyisoprenoid-binding protein YceI
VALLELVRGRFTQFTGTVELDDNDITRSKVRAEIVAASISTNEAKRDAHLRSADFFDVATYPLLTFVSKTIAKHGDELQLLGALTIHGITRDITLEVEQLGATNDPWNQVLEAGGFMVGDKIELSLDIEAVRAAAKVAA